MARARTADSGYFNAINVTPFIDVMLVLLVIILLSLPIASHKLPLDLPQPGPALPAAAHQLAIDRAGMVYFDGRTIADAELPATLAAMQTDPSAVLQLNPDPEARYERFDQILAMVKRAGVTRLGFVGNRPFER